MHLQDVIDYLTKLEDFVISYSRTKSAQQVWLTLRNLDETTRKKWCEMYRKNLPVGISLAVHRIREAMAGASDPEPRVGRHGSR